MRLLEIYFWVALYWALYIPVSLFLYFVTEQGDPLGILLIGVLFTIILTVYLALQDDCLFERWEPAIVVYGPAKRTAQPVPIPQPVEVKHYAKEEKPKPQPAEPTRQPVGFEPGAKMRTDVDLSLLTADDDDILG